MKWEDDIISAYAIQTKEVMTFLFSFFPYRCMHLKTLILDDIRRSDGYCIEALMEAIVDTAPQLMSISLEQMSLMEDEHVHVSVCSQFICQDNYVVLF